MHNYMRDTAQYPQYMIALDQAVRENMEALSAVARGEATSEQIQELAEVAGDLADLYLDNMNQAMRNMSDLYWAYSDTESSEETLARMIWMLK